MTPEIGPGVVLIGAVFGCMWGPFAIAVNRLLRPPASGPGRARRADRGAELLADPRVDQVLPGAGRAVGGSTAPPSGSTRPSSRWPLSAGTWLVSVALLLANTGLLLVLGAVRPALLTGPPAAAACLYKKRPGTPAAMATAGTPARPQHRRACGAGSAAGCRRNTVGRGLLAGSHSARSASPRSPPPPDPGPLAFALTAPFPAVRQVTIALVQPGNVQNPTQRVNEPSEALTSEFSANGRPRVRTSQPDRLGELSVADDLTLDHGLLRQIEQLSAQDHAEILASQDSNVPGPKPQPERRQRQRHRRRPGKGRGAGQPVRHPGPVREDPAGSVRRVHPVPQPTRLAHRRWPRRGEQHDPGRRRAHTLTVTTTPNGQPLTIGVLICFESAFPDMSRVETDQGAQVIVYQSSTSTFQGTWVPTSTHRSARCAPRRPAARSSRPR